MWGDLMRPSDGNGRGVAEGAAPHARGQTTGLAALARSRSGATGLAALEVGLNCSIVAPMYRDFLDDWLRSASKTRHANERPTRPLSLWAYGRTACLRSFRRELAAALKRRRRRAVILDVADMKRLAVRWERPAASAEDRKRLEREVREIERAGVVGLVVDPAEISGGLLDVVHHVVGARYNARKTTVVLSRTDPATAYRSIAKGQDRHTMPWLVGRILEHGDAVEVIEDGIYCTEFVFHWKAADDYRIKILKDRVGRVAVLRRKWDDDWGDGAPDDEGEEWKRGRE